MTDFKRARANLWELQDNLRGQYEVSGVVMVEARVSDLKVLLDECEKLVGQDVRAHKIMTRDEYDALNLQGWHCVNHSIEPGATHLMYGIPKEQRDRDQETGWLIEGYGSKHNIYRAEWLTADIYTHADDRDHWTKDASKALRFARKADADAVIAALGWTEARATEHQWTADLEAQEQSK